MKSGPAETKARGGGIAEGNGVALMLASEMRPGKNASPRGRLHQAAIIPERSFSSEATDW